MTDFQSEWLPLRTDELLGILVPPVFLYSVGIVMTRLVSDALFICCELDRHCK